MIDLLKQVINLMPRNLTHDHRTRASACILSIVTYNSPNYIISQDPYTGLLGKKNECECLNGRTSWSPL